MNDINVHRGDVFYATLTGDGSIQYGIRPVIIVSNEMNNKHSPTVNVVPLTSKIGKKLLPVHVNIDPNEENGLKMCSVVLGEQLTIINKTSLKGKKIGCVSNSIMEKIQNAIQIQLGIV